MIQNYELKKYLVDSGRFDKFREEKRGINKFFLDTQAKQEKTNILLVGSWTFLQEMEEQFKAQEHYKELNQVYKARQNRIKRMSDKIDYLFTLGKCGFITLTFRNDVLENTSEETRHRYVTRYLKSQFKSYVANIDYGDLHEREHYHAVVLLNDNYESETLTPWKYGWYYLEIVNNENSKALANYIGKLKSHSLKKSGCRFIYSVDLKKSNIEQINGLNNEN